MILKKLSLFFTVSLISNLASAGWNWGYSKVPRNNTILSTCYNTQLYYGDAEYSCDNGANIILYNCQTAGSYRLAYSLGGHAFDTIYLKHTARDGEELECSYKDTYN